MTQGTLRCLIVDDEPPAHEVLKAHLAAIPSLQWVASCYSAPEALAALRSTPIDLMFLDIQLPKLSGTDFVRTLVHPPRIIFVTAFRDFAMDGFELGAIDYLLKPVSFERFVKAVNKAMDHPIAPSPVNAPASSRFLYFRTDRKMVKVFLSDIRYAESLKDYVRIITAHGPLITRLTLSALLEMLPEEEFLQIHRSFVVAKDAVDAYSSDMVRVGKQELPIGPLYREVVRQRMEALRWP
ncbi:MAG: response regulator transcription factor [Cyclobacteriaceae bacterium]|nr:response regulator transcription factor [Cyclobacteriaceae bacterium]